MNTFAIGLTAFFLQTGFAIQIPNLVDYCFEIDEHSSIGISSLKMTPQEFAQSRTDVIASINGIYFDKNGKSEGLAFIANNHFLVNHFVAVTARGYFVVSKSGKDISVVEKLEGKIENNFMVLGTHPILVKNYQVHPQAKQKGYGQGLSFRSAIGTKSGRDVCFAISINKITMWAWADLLSENDFEDALNLDGGPVSQLVVDKAVFGPGQTPTSLQIFNYIRSSSE